jgi:hypothetical protein
VVRQKAKQLGLDLYRLEDPEAGDPYRLEVVNSAQGKNVTTCETGQGAKRSADKLTLK